MARNLEAQEEVVAALWEFAAENVKPGTKARCTASGAEVRLEAVGAALTRIMAAFGCEETPIE